MNDVYYERYGWNTEKKENVETRQMEIKEEKRTKIEEERSKDTK